MDEKIQRHGVTHEVARQRAAVAWLERVFVNPLPVRAAKLLVLEAMRRLPDVDARPPAQRDASHAGGSHCSPPRA